MSRSRNLGTTLAALSLAVSPANGQQTPPAPGEPGATTPAAETPSTPATGETEAQARERESQERELARLERLKKIAEARKLLATEQGTGALAELGPLGTYAGATGSVTVDTSNNAVMEATILATRSLDEIGYAMGDRLVKVVGSPGATTTASPAPTPARPTDRAGICAEVRGNVTFRKVSAVRPVIIVAAGGATLTDQSDTFMIRTAAIGRELCAALAQADAAPVPPPKPGKPVKPGQEQTVVEGTGGGIPAVAAAVDTFARLFRADYKIYGITVTEDEKLLSRSVALRFLAATPRLPNPVLLPELFPPSPADADNSAVRRLAMLDELRELAVERIAKGPQPRLTDAVSAYDKALAGLTASDGAQAPLIGLVLRQAKLRQLMDGGAYLVVTDIQRMGGTSYDKKNFFTFLGGMPYFVSGSAAASYAVQDTATEAVLDALNLQVSGGYHRVNALPKSFNAPARR